MTLFCDDRTIKDNQDIFTESLQLIKIHFRFEFYENGFLLHHMKAIEVGKLVVIDDRNGIGLTVKRRTATRYRIIIENNTNMFVITFFMSLYYCILFNIQGSEWHRRGIQRRDCLPLRNVSAAIQWSYDSGLRSHREETEQDWVFVFSICLIRMQCLQFYD